jgi:protease I
MAKVAMPLASDFEDSEFTLPFENLRKAGHDVTIIGSTPGKTISGKRGQASATIDSSAKELKPDDFDALVIPGGHSPEKLRQDQDIVSFVKRFAETGKLIAAVCHGPQLLIAAEAVKGRTLTSWPSVRKELIDAGANWIDQEVVEDGNLITSRKPDDLEAFCRALLKRLGGSSAVSP